jgi:nucleotide-binding universal stress UspA family protein
LSKPVAGPIGGPYLRVPLHDRTTTTEGLLFDRILVPTDGSTAADAAVDHALRLADAFDSTIVALHVVDVRVLEGPLVQSIGSLWGDVPVPVWHEDLGASLQQRGERLLEEVGTRLRAAGRPVEVELEIGLPVETIAERARSVDLVVVGRRGEHAAFGSHPLGSTTQGVVRRAPKPVLVCPQGKHPLGRLLAAYDGSEHALRALEIAVGYAERTRVELHVVSVQNRAEEAERMAAEAEAYARGHDLQVVVHVREDDDAAERILEVAREVGAEIVAMGAFGRGRLREFLVGSTTQKVLTAFDHPVLLYR